MNKYVIYPQESIQAVSDAIKEKRGTTDRENYSIYEMPDAIRGISSGGGSSSGGGLIYTPIDLGMEIDTEGPFSHAINSYAPVYSISTDKFNEISNYFNQGGKTLFDNNMKEIDIYSIINTGDIYNSTTDIKIQTQNDHYISTNHLICGVYMETDTDRMIRNWMPVLLTDDYRMP